MRAPLKALATALLLAALVAAPVAAQTPSPIATLVADSIGLRGQGRIEARGNVEIFLDGRSLRASALIYDRLTGRLTIEGPLRLEAGTGVTLLASQAELDEDLRAGILRSARLVLENELQLAADRIDRVDGRFTQLTRVAASTCEVCAATDTPFWEIRASRVVHDEEALQLYFENAQLRVGGIPVLVLPQLRLPDPRLERATGFLPPSLRTTTRLATGVKLPYFFTLGPQADLTLTPFVSSRTRTLEARYRQVTAQGGFRFEGAVSDDSLQGDDIRAYLFGSGQFALPRDFDLRFDLELVTDNAYLLDYGYSDKDRLDSALTLSRITGAELVRLSGIVFNTLRDSEEAIEDTLPGQLLQARYRLRLPPTALGGEAWLGIEANALRRASDADMLGRDVFRFGANADWRRDWLIGPGLQLETTAGLAVDLYAVEQDSSFARAPQRVVPSLSATLSWPLMAQGAGGVSHLLIPTAQLAWSQARGDAVPNEDSTLIAFDEGNLFSLTRFSGDDAVETGLRANLGLSYTRLDPQGWSLSAVAGRILRFSDEDQFAASTGLAGSSSDWLVAGQIRLADGLEVTSRNLFDDALEFIQSETRLTLAGDRGLLGTSFIFLEPSPSENRPDRTSEWQLDARYRINRHWIGRVDWRYNIEAERAARAGIGLRYQNECIGFDLAIARRFTSSASVIPTTDLSFRVSLDGFGTGVSARDFRRGCGG